MTTVVQQQVVIAGSALPQVVVVEEASQRGAAVSHGVQGPKGPIGPAGGTAFTRLAAAPLSALRVVWEDPDGLIRPLDFEDADHIGLLCGITVTAASAPGQAVTVQRSGPVDVPGLGLQPGPVWLGSSGGLTQDPPVNGFDVQVGSVVSGQRMYIDISSPINL